MLHEKTLAKNRQLFFWFKVRDLNILDIFYKNQNFNSWLVCPVITHWTYTCLSPCIRDFSSPLVPNILYSRGKIVDMVCQTVGQGPGLSLESSKKVKYLEQQFQSKELRSSRQRALDNMNTKCKQSSLSAAGQLYMSKPLLQVVYFF